MTLEKWVKGEVISTNKLNSMVDTINSVENSTGEISTVKGEVEKLNMKMSETNSALETEANKIKYNYNNSIIIFDNEINNKYLLNKPCQIKHDKPVITVTKSSTSTISNATKVDSTIAGQTVLNSKFTYPVFDMKRADWKPSDGTYGATYPDYLYVKNTSVTTTNSSGDIIVEFEFNGDLIELVNKGTGGRVLIKVDEGVGFEYITQKSLSIGGNDGGQYLVKIDFKSAKSRRIRVEYASTYFGGAYINNAYTILPSTRILNPKAIFLGDSFVEGSGGDTPHKNFSSTLCQLIGWECWNSGSGATGFLNTGTTGRVKFFDRLQHDVVSHNPDIVVIAGGSNDITFDKTLLGDEVDKVIKYVKTNLPNAKIYVLSNFVVQGVTTNIINTNEAIKSKAILNNVPYIDSVTGTTYDKNGLIVNIPTGTWITGVGSVSDLKDSGNAYLYTASDKGHPSELGYRYIGERMAREFLKVLY